ncbi:hypothetical protein KY311_01515 [Candidatus Woesearchaeota archaeon]|nr:hypothetical protein [Candidatus Woesearchaeota archaeon]MBW3017254.1 hypothetical protein [Candidatus Woesearchaeota archaeon]
MEFTPVEKLTAKEIREEMSELTRHIRTLQWDKNKDQINPAKLAKLEKLQQRYKELVSRVEVE